LRQDGHQTRPGTTRRIEELHRLLPITAAGAHRIHCLSHQLQKETRDASARNRGTQNQAYGLCGCCRAEAVQP
jgi:hypothetical protein